MAVTVDARGLPCPQPVIRTRNAMREADEIIALVTEENQVSNVRRLAERSGWQVVVEKRQDAYAVHMVKGEATCEVGLAPEVTAQAGFQPTVLAVSSDRMGRGEEELGTILMRSFFYTLTEIEPLPKTIIFFNAGVKLTAEDSPILEDLRAVEAKGVELLVCGTCVEYFGLKERIAAGAISNMYTIAETLLNAGRVVSL
ncbi:MAG TPA: sulfurtransferase-like selenium metabolism protein YedF [Anaerolineae bacterium]|nr:sulfurtransferase-like selenium metabolism protein YedF [Anaerolineae bacterium]